jgi:hypothetical protein
MSKGYRFWIDTETTGLSREHDQVLEAAGIVEDAAGNEVERFEYRIKLKASVTPGPIAIVINKINPYSRAWARASVTENEAAKGLAALARKYTEKGGGVKPFFTAYNADFDKDMVQAWLARSGERFSALFNKSVFDPLKTARQLTAIDGPGRLPRLVTRIKTYGGKASYSSSLEDVMAGLGLEYEGEAHRAMTDVIAMRAATRKLFRLATGHDMQGLSADPAKYEEGSVVRLVTDSKSSGAKVRSVLILKNLPDQETVVGLDEDDIKKTGGFADTAVRQFNYGTIIGEMAAEPDAGEALRDCLEANRERVEALAKKKVKPEADGSSRLEGDAKAWSLVEQVQHYVSRAPDKAAAAKVALERLLERLKGNAPEAKSILSRAETLACAKGLPAWSSAAKEGIRVLERLSPPIELRVGLHPRGHYVVGLNYERGDRPAKELKDCKSKKDVQAFLNIRIGKVQEMSDFVDGLPASEEFADPKHPAVIEGEVQNAIDTISVKGASDDVKAGVAGLLLKLQETSPKTFLKYKLPIDPSEINDPDYWKASEKKPGPGGGSSGSGGIESSPAAIKEAISAAHSISRFSGEAAPEPIGAAPDHVRPGDKLAKAPCALCGRPLSAKISLLDSMGPTCKKNFSQVEYSTGPLEPFCDEFKPYSPLAAPGPGDLAVIRVQGTEILAEFVAAGPSQAQVIDRRKINRLLATGVSPSLAAYLALLRLQNGAISGVAKIKASSQGDEPADAEA